MPKTGGIYLQNKDWTNIGPISVTSTGAYTFTIPSSTVTVGAVYSHNGKQYICTASIAASTSLVMGGTGAPLASGTLTLVSGSGPSTLAFSAVSSSIPVLGTGGFNNVWMRIIDGEVQLRLEYKHTVAGTTGTGQYMFFLDPSIFPYSFDNTKLTPQTVFNPTTALNYPYTQVGVMTAQMNTSNSVVTGAIGVFGNFFVVGGTAGSSAAGGPGNIGSGYLGFGQGATMAYTANARIPLAGMSAYN
jgi:hypothetical protein